MKFEELEFLARLASTVQSWTELGGYCGRSFLAAGISLPKGAFIQVVDIGLGWWSQQGQTIFDAYTTLFTHRPDLNIALCKMESSNAASLLKGTDVVFIDAAHSLAAVSADITAWKSKARILCGHDYSDSYPHIKRLVHEQFGDQITICNSVWCAGKQE